MPVNGGSSPDLGAPGVREALPDDVAPMCATLARAFADDPIAGFLLPDRRRRPGGLRAFFGAQIAGDLLAFGGVYTTDDHAGVAAWAPPGKPTVSGLRALVGLVPVLPFVAGAGLPRALRFLAHMESIHPKEPHWYLATLGTDPPRQGGGVGSALLRPVLARCDREGTRAYLESSKERNLPFYRRHGFEVTGEFTVAGSPTVWTMWRDPRPTGG
ncbi:MAG: GNAT family N-acetyltransferase [Acidimicrobiales bacterium]